MENASRLAIFKHIYIYIQLTKSKRPIELFLRILIAYKLCLIAQFFFGKLPLFLKRN